MKMRPTATARVRKNIRSERQEPRLTAAGSSYRSTGMACQLEGSVVAAVPELPDLHTYRSPGRGTRHSGCNEWRLCDVAAGSDIDYQALIPQHSGGPERMATLVGALIEAWSAAYRASTPANLYQFGPQPWTFLFDFSSETGAPQWDRTVAAWGLSTPGRRLRDQAYQRGYPSPNGRAERQLERGHMVPHQVGGDVGQNVFRRTATSTEVGQRRESATEGWSGRSAPRPARSSSVVCSMSTTQTSRLGSNSGRCVLRSCTSSGFATDSTDTPRPTRSSCDLRSGPRLQPVQVAQALQSRNRVRRDEVSGERASPLPLREVDDHHGAEHVVA
jgi:hypothetical protein